MKLASKLVICAIIASLASLPGAAAQDADDDAARNACVSEYLEDGQLGPLLSCLGSGQCRDSSGSGPGPSVGVNGDCRVVVTDAEKLCIGYYRDTDKGLYIHREYVCGTYDPERPSSSWGQDRAAAPCWHHVHLAPPEATVACDGVFRCDVEVDPAIPPTVTVGCTYQCPASEGNPEVTEGCRIIFTDHATEIACVGYWHDHDVGPFTYRHWHCEDEGPDLA